MEWRCVFFVRCIRVLGRFKRGSFSSPTLSLFCNCRACPFIIVKRLNRHILIYFSIWSFYKATLKYGISPITAIVRITFGSVSEPFSHKAHHKCVDTLHEIFLFVFAWNVLFFNMPPSIPAQMRQSRCTSKIDSKIAERRRPIDPELDGFGICGC